MIRSLKRSERQNGCDDAATVVIGESRKMKEAVQSALKVAKSRDTTVLIEGETGTGKELIARIIHDNSGRAARPYVCLNCGAVNRDLVESEFFGYEKGTFTGGLQDGKKGKFELADGGTVLLDEISELVPSAQVKLLRFLEEREFYPVGGTETKRVDVRIVALTNKSLEDEIKKGTFREDLFYRLNVVKISLPSLRSRREDILSIALFYMNIFNRKFGKSFRGFSRDASDALVNFSWPGNVRELKNVIERVIVMEDDRIIKPQHLAFLEHQRSSSDAAAGKGAEPAVSRLMKEAFEHSKQKENPGMEIPASGISLDELNKRLILHALHITKGNRAQAAKLLGISRAAAIYRIQKYGLENKVSKLSL